MNWKTHKPGKVYEPEIDGLRAIAILGVMFFHVGFSTFPGGFVGVDVFFVISGFLITRLIVIEFRQSNSFRFSRFYMRRIRRLFPALVLTIIITAIASFLLFSPEQLKKFSVSSAAAVVSLSNFYFWSQANYFDTQAISKPLLHTWSLSVEEQFYLIWPAIIVFMLWRFGERAVVAVLAVACLASLVIGEYWLLVDREAAFYLLPARVVELGIGALLVWVNTGLKRHEWYYDLISLFGIGLIVYASLTFEETIPFPGLNALIPCVGTAMLIYSARASYFGVILRLPVLVWIGRISYSLYLVHWPVIVFYTAYTYQKPAPVSQWGIIALSILLAWLQYRFIEERFRYVRPGGWSVRSVVITAALTASAVLFASITIYASGGFPGRIPESRLTLSDLEQRQLQKKMYCSNFDPSLDKKIITCQNYRHKDKDLFIWGDSHALHLVAGLSENYPEFNIYVAYMSACVPQSGFGGYVWEETNGSTEKCIARNHELLKFFLSRPPANILLSGAKRGTPSENAGATRIIVESLREAGNTVAVLGDFIRPGIPLVDCMSVPDYMLSDQYIQKRCTGDEKAIRREIKYNMELSAELPYLINPNDIECLNNRCIFINKDGLLYRDNHHLSITGSIYYINKVHDLLPFK